MRVLVLAVALISCTDESSARKTLEAHGFTDIKTTGWSPFVCGKDDTTETGFEAKNQAGQRVTGTVCCGLIFKGCTVRF